MDWKIGITQWSLPGAIADCVENAAKLGLCAVQVDLGSSKEGYGMTDPALQAKLMADSARTGVEIASVVLNDLCGCGFVHPADDPRSATAYRTLELGVETAAKMGVRSICMPSFFDNAIRDDATYARTVEAYRYVCALARKAGVTVYTENVMEPEMLDRFFRDVGDENLKLLFDSQNYHQMAGVDAVPVYEFAKDRCGEILHVKDGDGELSNRRLGEGSSDFPRTLRALVQGGFRGVYILENNYDTLDEVAVEAQALRAMLDTALA